MATRNSNKSCRSLVLELLNDDGEHTAEEVYAACDGHALNTVTNTLSALIAEGHIVRRVSITFQTAQNRRNSGG